MKKLYFLLILSLFLSKANAQWVTIPDANFVAFLQQQYPQCMIGNQMDTTCSAVVNETVLNCSNKGISDLTGIQYFNNLQHLSCIGNNLSSLPILPNNLMSLYCGSNQLTSLPTLPNNLMSLHCGSNQLTSLPSMPSTLYFLSCEYNQLTTLPALPQSLTYLLCNNNQLTSLPLLGSLNALYVWDNQLTSLNIIPGSIIYDLGIMNNLFSGVWDFSFVEGGLFCSNNQITSITNVSSTLTHLVCDNNLLTTLPSLPSSLMLLECYNNSLTSLPSLPNSLEWLDCHNNQLTSIPELPGILSVLDIRNNVNLICLPQLKSIFSFYFQNTGLQCLPNYGNIAGSNPPLNSIPLCDLFNQNGCDAYWNISGKVYSDNNLNCIDDNEPKLGNFKLQLYQNGNLIQQIYSGGEGLYSFDTDTGTFTYTVDTTDLPAYVTCPSSGFHTSILTPADSMDYNMDFAMQCKPGFDVGVKNIVRTSGQFFPGNYATIKVNAGDMANFYGLSCAAGVSGTVTIDINGPVSYISESPGALVPGVSGNTILSYNISDFGTINFHSDFRFIVQTDTLAQAGNVVCITVNVTPVTGDNDTINNFLQHCFTVVNSFDPNDKQVFPSGVVLPDHEWLTYTIRFQNTGTAPAQHIYILDTLDQNLDVSTFTLLSYSHDNLTQVLGDVVKFNFPNINLADSTNDEPNSHGYVQYKIKLNPGLPIGTVISNIAYNYFDFNPPIATNTVQNQIYFLNPTITPNNLILCPNESDTLWTQVYDSYQWFKDGNLIPGANNQYLVVDYFNDAGSQFMVEVDSAGVIAQSAPVLVDGWAFLPPFVITEGTFTIGSMGEVMICPGDTVYLILGQPYDTNIQWTESGNIIPGANNDTLIVTQAGLYHVTGAPSQCPNYVQGLFTDIEVIMSPPLSPTITPNNLILCPNESDTLWTQQFGTYQWYKDGTLIPGGTNQFLVVDAFSDAGSQFHVEVSQGNCTGTSSQVLVDGWVFLLPYVISEGTFTVGPNGEMLMCPGDTAYLILGQPYDTNIQWTESGNIIPGANNDTLMVTQSGNYHVSGAPSTCPNYIQNLGVTIEVIVQGPAEPVITYSGPGLETQPGFASYQWYLNGNPAGTNTNTFPSPGPGMYTVIVTDVQGCTAESQPFIISSIIENSISGIVNVNYNSTTSTLHISRSKSTAETEIFVVDVLGRRVVDEKMQKGVSEMEINLNHIKPGIYLVNLSEGGSVKFFVE
jgi:uncharacterized repeat protein (TIGR01451 family)